MVKDVHNFYCMCKKGLGGGGCDLCSANRSKILLNKGIATYTKGMNWSFLAHTSFPVQIHTHNLLAITAFTPLKRVQRKALLRGFISRI